MPQPSGGETRALWEAMDECGLDESFIVMREGEERMFKQGGKKIHCIPAWRWLLGGLG